MEELTDAEVLEAEKELEVLGEIRASGMQAIGYHCVFIESGTVAEAEELQGLLHKVACLVNQMRERAGNAERAWFTTLYDENPVSAELDARYLGSIPPTLETDDDGARGL